MPDALQLLRDDHNAVKELFRQFEQTDDADARRDIAARALMQLEVHTAVEEELLYPTVRHNGEPRQRVDEAEEEHHVAKLLIDELKDMTPRDERYRAKFMVLADSVKRHIDEEEGEIFPRAAEAGRERLSQLGEQMEQRKMEIQEEAQKPRRRAAPRRTTRAAAPARGRPRAGAPARRRTTRAAAPARRRPTRAPRAGAPGAAGPARRTTARRPAARGRPAARTRAAGPGRAPRAMPRGGARATARTRTTAARGGRATTTRSRGSRSR